MPVPRFRQREHLPIATASSSDAHSHQAPVIRKQRLTRTHSTGKCVNHFLNSRWSNLKNRSFKPLTLSRFRSRWPVKITVGCLDQTRRRISSILDASAGSEMVENCKLSIRRLPGAQTNRE